MVKIEIKVDCGNSPNKELLKRILCEGALGNLDYVVEHLDTEVVLNKIGHFHLEGKSKVREELEKLPDLSLQKLIIHEIITHGKDAAINGAAVGVDGKQYDFCFIVTLKLGKKKLINSIMAYII